jgi:hypothetical protein
MYTEVLRSQSWTEQWIMDIADDQVVPDCPGVPQLIRASLLKDQANAMFACGKYSMAVERYWDSARHILGDVVD